MAIAGHFLTKLVWYRSVITQNEKLLRFFKYKKFFGQLVHSQDYSLIVEVLLSQY